MADENFYESAVRHWMDGLILERQEEYDNAVCMYGFAAECALKKIMERVYSINDLRSYYGHLGEGLYEDIRWMMSGDLILPHLLDPACGLRLSRMTPPAILFEEHPERRYFRDGVYSEEDARICRDAVEDFIKEMAKMRLDGYL